jgi:uncharacterized protein YlxW (UPF0749 family)
MRTVFTRLFWITLFIVGCFIVNRNVLSVSAQEAEKDPTTQEKTSERDQRLSELERQLQKLANEIKELRGTTKKSLFGCGLLRREKGAHEPEDE